VWQGKQDMESSDKWLGLSMRLLGTIKYTLGTFSYWQIPMPSNPLVPAMLNKPACDVS
jgi:hypothetical protein